MGPAGEVGKPAGGQAEVRVGNLVPGDRLDSVILQAPGHAFLERRMQPLAHEHGNLAVVSPCEVVPEPVERPVLDPDQRRDCDLCRPKHLRSPAARERRRCPPRSRTPETATRRFAAPPPGLPGRTAAGRARAGPPRRPGTRRRQSPQSALPPNTRARSRLCQRLGSPTRTGSQWASPAPVPFPRETVPGWHGPRLLLRRRSAACECTSRTPPTPQPRSSRRGARTRPPPAAPGRVPSR